MSIADFARIPFIDEIVDAARLSERLGFAAEPTRIRVKPGHGALLAWRRPTPDRGPSSNPSTPDRAPSSHRPTPDRGPSSNLSTPADWGWIAIVTDPKKLANIRRRAERRGEEVRLHADGADHGVLISGRLPSDPKLVRAIARPDSGFSTDAEVRGYNPGRRVLLRDGDRFVRISSKDSDHLINTARQWQQWGIPTLPVDLLGRRHTSVHSPWWGTSDLERSPDAGIAMAVGESIAELHRQVLPAARPTSTGATDRSAADGAHELAAAGRTLVELVPELAAEVRPIMDELSSRLDHSGGAQHPLHGDLSPDQVLVDGTEFRIIDLDRAGTGPTGVDVGAWVARCRMNRFTDVEGAFLDGYARRGGHIDDVEAWSARALLTTAIEPFRQCRPDWRARATAIVTEAKEALRR